MNDKRSLLRLSPASVALLTLLAFGLRLHRLDLQPLWGDEGWSLYFASMDLGEMIRLTAEDIHPPLYYLLLGGWLRLVGSTPEVARIMSSFWGVLLVPLIYRVAARLFDRPAGLAAAGVVTVSPFAIYYSQEVRMYGLVALLGLGSFYCFSQQLAHPEKPTPDSQPQTAGGQRPRRYFWGYVLTTAAALYTMYYAVFLPIFQLIFFITTLRRQQIREWRMHAYFRSLSVTLLLYLPWVFYATLKLVAYVQGKRTAEGYIPLGPLHFIESHLVAFSLGHLPDSTRLLAWGTILFLLVALLGLLYHPRYHPESAQGGNSHPSSLVLLYYLFLPLLLGYLINLVYPFTPRYFERTLMLAAPAWWLLLGAGLAWLWQRSGLALLGISSMLLLIQTAVLWDFYSMPRYQDEDYRPLMAYVRSRSSPDDVFLASYQWQAGYYQAYLPTPRPALYVVPGWGETWAADEARMRADLNTLLRNHPRLWFPAYQALGRLWETQVETYLNQSAFPVQVDWRLASTKLLLYTGADQLAPAAAPFNFANQLLMEQASVGQVPTEAGRGVVPVALVWRTLTNLANDHRVALRLTDSHGRTWASRDSLPRGGNFSFTKLAGGERLVDHHGLAIPAGTPPGNYQLRLGIYDQADDHPLDVLDAQGQPQGVEAILSEVEIVLPDRPVAPEALPVQYQRPFDFAQQVRLLGFSLGAGPFRAGDTLRFSLFWQALAGGNEAYVVFAQLQDEGGKPVALSETPPVYPSQLWTAGTLLRDPREIHLPATLPAGTYRLAVGLLRADRSRLPVGRNDQAVLTNITTTQRAHDFSPLAPQHALNARFGEGALLVGYELRGGADAHPSQLLTLILYWKALDTFDRGYTGFVHVVDANDRIVGQRDQVPGDGEFPTTSWIPWEHLTDVYAISINPEAPPGVYWIELGLYDPLDGARLPVTDATGQPLGDRLLLNETPIRVD